MKKICFSLNMHISNLKKKRYLECSHQLAISWGSFIFDFFVQEKESKTTPRENEISSPGIIPFNRADEDKRKKQLLKEQRHQDYLQMKARVCTYFIEQITNYNLGSWNTSMVKVLVSNPEIVSGSDRNSDLDVYRSVWDVCFYRLQSHYDCACPEKS